MSPADLGWTPWVLAGLAAVLSLVALVITVGTYLSQRAEIADLRETGQIMEKGLRAAHAALAAARRCGCAPRDETEGERGCEG